MTQIYCEFGYDLLHISCVFMQHSAKIAAHNTNNKPFRVCQHLAWQQHDIQELCRVMFDALEKKFEGTDQAQLIKQLYEGKRCRFDYFGACS